MAGPRSPYQLGRWFGVMPIPPIEAHCIPLPAGPLTFVIEPRQLTDALAGAALRAQGVAATGGEPPLGLDDFGATLHVHGTDDGLEHLRFDCFENEPHYHYVRHAEGGNLVCRIDQHAEGDPIAWTLDRLRTRLPEMLEFAGVPELATQARDEHDKVLAVLDDVAALLDQAREQATVQRADARA